MESVILLIEDLFLDSVCLLFLGKINMLVIQGFHVIVT